MKLLKIMFLGLLAWTAAACSRGRGDDGDGTVAFSVVPTIQSGLSGEMDGVATRARVTGTSFPQGSAIGLELTSDAVTLPAFYTNFYAQCNAGGVWYYYLNGMNIGPLLAGFLNWGNIKVCGYYPYNAAVTAIDKIPFRIATLTAPDSDEATGTDAYVGTDYMVSSTGSKNMSSPGYVTLQFMHLMTAIDLQVTRSDGYVPVLRLDTVVYQIDNDRRFIISGTCNAKDPDLTSMANNILRGDSAAKMTISYPSGTNITTTVTQRLLIIMPELRQSNPAGVDDATVKLTFRFTDQDGSHYLFDNIAGGDPSVSFKLSDVSNAGTADRGLLAGTTYRVTASVGTYTHFAAPTTGVPMSPHINDLPLTDEEKEPIDI